MAGVRRRITGEMTQKQLDTIARRSEALRYKRPALATMGYNTIMEELEQINEACYDVMYYMDTDDGRDLINSVIGDEDQAWEFRMAFADLAHRTELLVDAMYRNGVDAEEYDDCTVALIGNRYDVVGYDGYKEAYFALTSYYKGLAETEAGKRIMRRTKQQMLATIGRCVGTMMAFYDLRQQYDYLKATMDIIRDENTSLLDAIREIDRLYQKAVEDKDSPESRKFDKLVKSLPARVWLE